MKRVQVRLFVKLRFALNWILISGGPGEGGSTILPPDGLALIERGEGLPRDEGSLYEDGEDGGVDDEPSQGVHSHETGNSGCDGCLD